MKKSFPLVLSFIILISSLNFNLSAHYCGQLLVDIALFGEAEVCSMAKDKVCEADEMPCCSDRDIIIEGEDYLFSKVFSKNEVIKTEGLIATLNFPILYLTEAKLPTGFHNHYKPPLIEREIPILIQSFLL